MSKPTDEFGNDEHDIRMVAIAAHVRGDYEAERIALDRLALMERNVISTDLREAANDGHDDGLRTGTSA